MSGDGGAYTAAEMMAVAGSRYIRNGMVCFVGIGLPGKAAILAKHHHAPDAVLVYESGVVDTNPTREPLSIGDGDLAEGARTLVSLPEMFNYWLQGGRIDLGFLGAAQIDRLGNINTTVIGDYETPSVRLPGSGGAPEIAGAASETIVILRHSTRALVEKIDFVTTVGHPAGPGSRAALGLRGAGPIRIVTDLAVLTFEPDRREFMLTALHPEVETAAVVERTGWKLAVAPSVAEIEPPTEDELRILRRITRD